MNSSQQSNGGPAFPCPVGHIECAHPEGMSMRDYFAAHAPQCPFPTPVMEPNQSNAKLIADMLAAWSFDFADEMIKARESAIAKATKGTTT